MEQKLNLLYFVEWNISNMQCLFVFSKYLILLLGIIIYLNLLQKYNLMNWVYFFNLQCQIVMKDLTLTTGCPSPNTVYRCKDNNNYSWSPSLNCLSAWALVTPEMASSSVGEAEAGCQDVWYSQYSQGCYGAAISRHYEKRSSHTSSTSTIHDTV